MRYRVNHTTRYQYSEAISLCHNEARLFPRSLTSQRCIDAGIDVAPQPKVYHERNDAFGNRVAYFSIEQSHTVLQVTAHSEVELLPLTPPQLEHSPTWEEAQKSLHGETSRDVLDARQFQLDSPLIRSDAEFVRYAVESFPSHRPFLSAVHDLMQRIFTEFTYDAGFTTVATPVRDVLAHKRGVCQDFAHFAIACLRSLGFAARYASGYLETRPPEGQKELIGATASHAWVSVYCPELGWVDFDPTNNLIPADQHIVVAWGRDYSDVTPLKGTILGGVQHELQVNVAVTRVEGVVTRS
ncbi:MAG: transglutaminase family protein [Deltaproteobacteria bacterium]|nr:transglutaminase family protein [Deltaproteobacteria bacterium]